MSAASRIGSILRADPLRWRLLDVVRTLDLPDCWIGAGFVRNAVWDHLHERSASPLTGDIDVIWYDRARTEPAEDRKFEAMLRLAEPSFAWSVKNQARMHIRNGNTPYSSSVDAMRYWPETATAIAARRQGLEGFEIAAPLGLDDLMNLVLRPSPHFSGEKRAIFEDRSQTKGWFTIWPLLRRT
jgi:hypothetical protein